MDKRKMGRKTEGYMMVDAWVDGWKDGSMNDEGWMDLWVDS